LAIVVATDLLTVEQWASSSDV